MQTLLTSLLVAWAGIYCFKALLPRPARRLRGWLARHADGRLPAPLVAWLRPAFPRTGCGCGAGCAGISQAPGKLRN